MLEKDLGGRAVSMRDEESVPAGVPATDRPRPVQKAATEDPNVRRVRLLLVALGVRGDADQVAAISRILGRDLAALDDLTYRDTDGIEDAVGGGLRERPGGPHAASESALADVPGGLSHRLDGSPVGRVAAGVVRRPRHPNGHLAARTREHVWQVAIEDSPVRGRSLIALRVDGETAIRLEAEDAAHLIAALAVACEETVTPALRTLWPSRIWRNVLGALGRSGSKDRDEMV